jgi:hypothetical protein
MFEEVNNIAKKPFDSQDYDSGIGKIILPTGISRIDYINFCQLRGCVSILVEGEQIKNNIAVCKSVLNYLEFPETNEDFGSLVYWQKIHQTGDLIITSILSGKLSNFEEDAFNIEKIKNNNIIGIKGNIKNKTLDITINSDDEIIPKFTISINSKNKKVVPELLLSSSGSIILRCLKELTLESESAIKFKNKESYISIEDNIITFDSEKYVFGNGDNAGILGSIFEKFMEEFIDELANITVKTPMGQMRIVNEDKILKMKNHLQLFISENFLLN